MSETESAERWKDNRRRDGLLVNYNGGEDAWLICPSRGAAPMVLCPCCDKPFRTAEAAMRVADFVYPMTRDD